MNIGVVFAGGAGTRLGMVGRPKQFIEVNGKPIIIHTLEHFEACEEVDTVVVVCLINWIDYLWKLVEDYKLKKVSVVVPGGATGQESIYQGLLAAEKISGDEDPIVLIHDGVRPLINAQLLQDNIHTVKQYGSAITCGKMTETAVRVDGDCVIEAYQRLQIQCAKAPQSFWLHEILEAHEDARCRGKNDYIDSCSLMMHYKDTLHCIECGADNIKITQFEDIYLMQAILRAREDKANFLWGDH